MNRVLLIGNIGASPVIRETDEKILYAVLYLATNEKWIDSKGAQQTRTDWHRIVVFRDNLVNFIEKFLKKGARVIVEGKLQNRKFMNDDGTEGNVSEVIITRKGPGFVTWLHSPLAPVACLQEEAEKKSTHFATNTDDTRYE
ncbi:MAG: single-stranded DNA-binding protein [Pseudomonadota bacterium]